MLRSRYHHLTGMWRDYLSSASILPQADRWLTEYFRRNKQYGSKDRRFYADAFFSALRFGNIILRIHSREWQQRDPECNEYSTAFKNINDKDFFGTLSVLVPSLHVPFEKKKINVSKEEIPLPLWLREEWDTRVRHSHLKDSMAKTFLNRLANKPPLYIRPNFEERVTELIEELEANGFKAVKHTNGAIALQGNPSVFTLPSFRKGLFEIQDLASQEIGASVDVHPGMMIWDACAGGGGKTLQIAANLKGRGRVYGSDVRSWKLDDAKKRARKAGFANVTTFDWDGTARPPLKKEVEKRGGFHRVLVDAPCSASGTLRRNPDVRYRIEPDQLDDLNKLQMKLLTNASQAVKPGGKLIYATCSFLVRENEDIVNSFLTEHSWFNLETMKLVGSPWEDADTMFIAVMKNTGV